MFSFDVQHVAMAAVAALVLTTASISAAVGPARAVETAPVAYAAGVVQSSVVANG